MQRHAQRPARWYESELAAPRWLPTWCPARLEFAPECSAGSSHLAWASWCPQEAVISHAELDLPPDMSQLCDLSISGLHMGDWQVISRLHMGSPYLVLVEPGWATPCLCCVAPRSLCPCQHPAGSVQLPAAEQSQRRQPLPRHQQHMGSCEAAAAAADLFGGRPDHWKSGVAGGH
jgi:hypothetical protein